MKRVREIVEANKVPMTLFVGLGGIGSQIIKGVSDRCRDSELDNVNFVVLDTNANDLEGIKDSKNNIYFVQTSSTSTVGDYLRVDEDAMDNWFPRNSVMYNKNMTDGAGQVRAISRLALNSTIKLNRLTPLYDAIDDLYRKTGEDLKYGLRVVMAFSTNGGTGSGIALPLSMLIRKYMESEYPTTTVNIRGMGLLPSVQNSKITSDTEKRSLRRNAYATIKEINAFMMKGSGFFDNNAELERYSNIHIDVPIAGSDDYMRLDTLPFDFCFLLDGTDTEDKTSISQEQYIEQASMCLYEQNIGPMKENSFGIEDNIIKELSHKDNLGRNRFGGLGASIIRYPYTDVADYVAYQWIIDKMGGTDKVDDWCKYDREFDLIHKKEVNDGVTEKKQTKINDYYVSQMKRKGNVDEFTKRMQHRYLRNSDKVINNFIKSLKKHIIGSFNDSIGEIYTDASEAGTTEYTDDYFNKKNNVAIDDVDKLQAYYDEIQRLAKDKAIEEATSIFENVVEGKIEDDFLLEKILVDPNGKFIHPNAMRFYLYDAYNNIKKKESQINIEGADSAVLDYTQGKEGAESIINLAKNYNDNNEIEDKPKNKDAIKALAKKMTNKFNQQLNGYYEAIEEFLESVMMKEVYRIALNSIESLNTLFEQFYDEFGKKTEELANKQEDLVNALKYKKGSTVYNLCCKEEFLQKLAAESTYESDEDILSPTLCREIFTGIKKNAKINNFNEVLEQSHKMDSIDIFDDAIVEYFRQTVLKDCDNLDVNVLEAIRKEAELDYEVRMEKAHKKAKLKGEEKQKLINRYIKKIIMKGGILAAPGIQRMSAEEPREIRLCAYNYELDKMREYNTTEIFLHLQPTATDTVSRYEIRFFNGLYNLTPDKIKKFSCGVDDKSGKRDCGTYFQAYRDYSRDIGPDSEKCKVISTHIDKRWDPVREFPEIDLNYQREALYKAHRAFVYSLVFGIVKYRAFSTYDTSIKNYMYENSDERLEDMIVSNGTACDEFYEVLDHFYISSATVKDTELQVKAKTKRDINRRVAFDNTEFARKLSEFTIPKNHEGPTSLFEIPLVYYSSVPSAQRFEGELDELVEAVVKVLREQIEQYESKKDVEILLWQILKKHFYLMIDNYSKSEALNCNMKLVDHPVVEIVYRTVKNILTEELNSEEIDKMRQIIKGTSKK